MNSIVPVSLSLFFYLIITFDLVCAQSNEEFGESVPGVASILNKVTLSYKTWVTELVKDSPRDTDKYSIELKQAHFCYSDSIYLSFTHKRTENNTYIDTLTFECTGEVAIVEIARRGLGITHLSRDEILLVQLGDLYKLSYFSIHTNWNSMKLIYRRGHDFTQLDGEVNHWGFPAKFEFSETISDKNKLRSFIFRFASWGSNENAAEVFLGDKPGDYSRRYFNGPYGVHPVNPDEFAQIIDGNFLDPLSVFFNMAKINQFMSFLP